MRRAPATSAVLIASVLLASACGGGGSPKPPSTVRAADAPKVSAPAPRKVVIVVDKKKTTTMTTGTTVQQVLDQAGVKLGRYDLVKPAREQPAGDAIKVLRLLSKPVTKTVRVSAPTIEKKSSSVPPWSQKELRKGRSGIKIVQMAYVRRKGKKVKAVIAQKVKRKPVARIVAVGPKSAGTGSAAKLDWAGLANCESHGNPKAVNPSGYYGLYQFSMSSWASVGGSGKPSDASAGEQTYRAQLLYNRVNGRWQGQWPVCGKFLFS
ncbi:transglycosylase family protein [Actinomadura violacea]|uniref:Transglycosylase family protein n=1 Tax=Actinomadura violacea TaxID=2819934 RepID=A0ABS3RTR3_9ACTN|nr:transglycosylase family protein [Actinomadura violacea]MBO2460052.1 transglycosylase family protein [Actinomadura violacea]